MSEKKEGLTGGFMDAKMAREIIKKWKDIGPPPEEDRTIGFADGYLAALRGIEVYDLLDFIDTVRRSASHPKWRKAATIVLAKFRATAGGK